MPSGYVIHFTRLFQRARSAGYPQVVVGGLHRCGSILELSVVAALGSSLDNVKASAGTESDRGLHVCHLP